MSSSCTSTARRGPPRRGRGPVQVLTSCLPLCLVAGDPSQVSEGPRVVLALGQQHVGQKTVSEALLHQQVSRLRSSFSADPEESSLPRAGSSGGDSGFLALSRKEKERGDEEKGEEQEEEKGKGDEHGGDQEEEKGKGDEHGGDQEEEKGKGDEDGGEGDEHGGDDEDGGDHGKDGGDGNEGGEKIDEDVYKADFETQEKSSRCFPYTRDWLSTPPGDGEMLQDALRELDPDAPTPKLNFKKTQAEFQKEGGEEKACQKMKKKAACMFQVPAAKCSWDDEKSKCEAPSKKGKDGKDGGKPASKKGKDGGKDGGEAASKKGKDGGKPASKKGKDGGKPASKKGKDGKDGEEEDDESSFLEKAAFLEADGDAETTKKDDGKGKGTPDNEDDGDDDGEDVTTKATTTTPDPLTLPENVKNLPCTTIKKWRNVKDNHMCYNWVTGRVFDEHANCTAGTESLRLKSGKAVPPGSPDGRKLAGQDCFASPGSEQMVPEMDAKGKPVLNAEGKPANYVSMDPKEFMGKAHDPDAYQSCCVFGKKEAQNWVTKLIEECKKHTNMDECNAAPHCKFGLPGIESDETHGGDDDGDHGDENGGDDDDEDDGDDDDGDKGKNGDKDKGGMCLILIIVCVGVPLLVGIIVAVVCCCKGKKGGSGGGGGAAGAKAGPKYDSAAHGQEETAKQPSGGGGGDGGGNKEDPVHLADLNIGGDEDEDEDEEDEE